MRTTVAVASTTPLTQLAAAFAVAVVIMIAVSQAAANQTTAGNFAEFFTLMLLLLTPLKRLADLNGPMQRGLAASESVFGLIDTPPETDSGENLMARARKTGIRGDQFCLSRTRTARPERYQPQHTTGRNHCAGWHVGRWQDFARESGAAFLYACEWRYFAGWTFTERNLAHQPAPANSDGESECGVV
jgi:ABC-type multidrug transport system fused ATPase/permease subunit